MKKVVSKIKKLKKHKMIKNIVNKIKKMKKLKKHLVHPVAKVKSHAKIKAKTKVKPKAKASAKAKIKSKPMVLEHKISQPVKKTEPKVYKPKINSMFGPANVKPYQPKKGEEYMSEEQLEHFRKVLLQWKSQLMEEVDRTMHHMKDESSNYPDPIDRASQEEEFNLELRARDRERKLLRKIVETLVRINDHDYGYCDDCGAEIGIRRLEARPTATQCIECKTVAEIREKQVGEGG